MIKNMNRTMTINSDLLTTEPKTKTKQTRTETYSQKWRSHGGFQSGRGKGSIGEKVQGIRSINVRYKTDGGWVKNSIGNGEAKELICMTHGQELR